jgi:hypothetical protein
MNEDGHIINLDNYISWVHEVERKAVESGVLFLQLGAANEPARRAVLQQCRSRFTVHEFIEAPAQEAGTYVIDQVEDLTRSPHDRSLGPLRERVSSGIPRGMKVILLSRAPRCAFPDVVGSSILADARYVHAPVVRAQDASQLPSSNEDGEDGAELLCRIVSELGTSLCATLDQLLFEHKLTGPDVLTALEARQLEALEGSSLIARSTDGSHWTWNLPHHLYPLKDAVDKALIQQVEPHSDLPYIVTNLWIIERAIRAAIRDKALNAWKKDWRERCLNGDLPGKVLSRAQESAYMAARSMKEVRDPLEWLTLGELLQLRQRKEIGDLGIESGYWRKFTDEILPIRNRLAHMRSPHAGDRADTVKWLGFMRRRL